MVKKYERIRVSEMCKAKRITIKQLSEMMAMRGEYVSRQTLSTWNNSRGAPTMGRLVAVAEALECSVNDLLETRDEP